MYHVEAARCAGFIFICLIRSRLCFGRQFITGDILSQGASCFWGIIVSEGIFVLGLLPMVVF